MVNIQELVKTYGDLRAVDRMSLEIHAGEIVGLLGPNGAGKTSTISIIAGLHPPTSGTVSIQGLDTQKQARAIRQLVGIVPQELLLYPTITGRDNLIFFGSIYGLKGKALKRRIGDVLEVVGLGNRARDVVATYSGGMKRRLNLACGLLHSPKLLLLDEPTVGVDPQSRNLIFENIKYLNRQCGMTVIYTTHYMEEAEQLCDRVAIMDQGRLVALDTPQALIHRWGQSVIEMKTNDATPAICEKIRAAVKVDEVAWTQGLIRVQTAAAGKTVVDILALLTRQGIALESLRIQEASLENVFLKLTGKSLRDDGRTQASPERETHS